MSQHQNSIRKVAGIFGASIAIGANDNGEKAEKPLRFVLLITSTPLTGTGFGAAASYLYKLDENSAPSQLQIGGQYCNTDSITTFLRNNAFLRGNKLISNTALLWSDINSEFDGDDGRRVEYKIKSISLAQKLLFQIKESVYLGGHIAYKDVAYSPNNEAGEDFLFDNGIADEESLGLGGDDGVLGIMDNFLCTGDWAKQQEADQCGIGNGLNHGVLS